MIEAPRGVSAYWRSALGTFTPAIRFGRLRIFRFFAMDLLHT
jgi:hypothetical protein